LDLLCACLDHPQKVLGGLCHRANSQNLVEIGAVAFIQFIQCQDFKWLDTELDIGFRSAVC